MRYALYFLLFAARFFQCVEKSDRENKCGDMCYCKIGTAVAPNDYALMIKDTNACMMMQMDID